MKAEWGITQHVSLKNSFRKNEVVLQSILSKCILYFLTLTHKYFW